MRRPFALARVWDRQIAPRFTLPAASAISMLAVMAAAVFVGGAVIAYRLIRNEPGIRQPGEPEIIALELSMPMPEAPSPTPLEVAAGQAAFDPSAVTYDPSGQYAFPIAGDPALYTWAHNHWDGTSAVDIEARSGLSYDEFAHATRATLVAITAGTLTVYNGDAGGNGYMLHGDDGFDYYYGHLSEQWAADGSRVRAGQAIGVIGNTGSRAQFIEPHLHLAIGPRDTLWTQQPSVNAAERLRALFYIGWIERPAQPVGYSVPQGWPVQHPRLEIVTPFEQDAGLLQPAIELGFSGEVPDTSLDVLATLDGEVNTIRWTAHYGTRIQITNRDAQGTVVISRVDEWLVEDGAVVHAGDVIGRWNPANRARLHYMIFLNGVIIDPTPSLGPVPAAPAGP